MTKVYIIFSFDGYLEKTKAIQVFKNENEANDYLAEISQKLEDYKKLAKDSDDEELAEKYHNEWNENHPFKYDNGQHITSEFYMIDMNVH
jgi:hypothetical protein